MCKLFEWRTNKSNRFDNRHANFRIRRSLCAIRHLHTLIESIHIQYSTMTAEDGWQNETLLFCGEIYSSPNPTLVIVDFNIEDDLAHFHTYLCESFKIDVWFFIVVVSSSLDIFSWLCVCWCCCCLDWCRWLLSRVALPPFVTADIDSGKKGRKIVVNRGNGYRKRCLASLEMFTLTGQTL